MTRFTKSANGKYMVSGKSYDMLSGTRAQVWHGTAYKTSGGLNKNALFQTKAGRIVSKAKHFTAKKDNRLVKAGYGTKKGKFGYVKLTKTKSKRGGAATTTSSPTSTTTGTTSTSPASPSMNSATNNLLNSMKPTAPSMPSSTMSSSSMPTTSMSTTSTAAATKGGSRKRKGKGKASRRTGRKYKRGGNGVNYALSPSSYHGQGLGTSGVDLQLFATSEN
jgi:hypothetical protein